VLEQAGLISRSRQAQFRPCRFESESLDSAVDWIQRHRRIWAERFDQLEQHLRTLQRPDPTEPNQPTEPNHKEPSQ
jgi:hypothetical protein